MEMSNIVQYLGSLFDIQVELLEGDLYSTGEDMDVDLGLINILMVLKSMVLC